MRTRRSVIPQRRRFFLGCEGQSEHGYGALLQLLADSLALHIHIELHDLQGGDPLAILESAITRLAKQVRNRGPFVARALLLDRDKYGQNQARDVRIEPLAQQHQFLLIWQDPCYEGFLLRHLPGCQSLRPTTATDAFNSLHKHWPEYQKALTARRLARRIGLPELALARTVEQDLASLLSLMGF